MNNESATTFDNELKSYNLSKNIANERHRNGGKIEKNENICTNDLCLNI